MSVWERDPEMVELESLRDEVARLTHSRGTLVKVLEYVHHVLTGGGPVEADLCNSVQLAADRLAAEVARLRAEIGQERNRANLSAGLVGDLKAEVDRLREQKGKLEVAIREANDLAEDFRRGELEGV